MKSLSHQLIWLCAAILLMSCGSIRLQPPRAALNPTPTPTRPPIMIGRNQNAEALTAAKSAVGQWRYGFAPLLLLDESRLVLTPTQSNVIMLKYPTQPHDPNGWLSVDSFVLAYSMQQQLLTNESVIQASVGQFPLAAPIEGREGQVSHFALWVSFKDGSGTTVDLTTLAPEFGAAHPANHLILPLQTAQQQFATWQHGILLNELQPLSIVKLASGSYYLLGQATATADKVTVAIQAHPIQLGSHIAPLRLLFGSRIEMTLNRQDLKQIQALLQKAGPNALAEQRELWQRRGDNSLDLTQVLEQNLPLLWHMATKLQLE
jgi:hypothetical protein